MRKINSISWIIIGIVSNTLPRNLPKITFRNGLTSLYYIGESLSFISLAVALKIILGIPKNIEDEKIKIVVSALFWLTINNILDELFFDPTKIGWNEIVFLIIILIRAYKQWKNLRAN